MRRNKKFYRDKKALRLEREYNKYYKVDRSKKSKKKRYKIGTGWRKDVSKRLCPQPIYKDLKKLVDLIAKTFTNYEFESYKDSYYKYVNYYDNIEEGLIILRDIMFRDIYEEEYKTLAPALQTLLQFNEYDSRAVYSDKIIHYKIYTLQSQYYKYLYIRKGPLYSPFRGYYSEPDDSYHKRLSNYIQSHNFWPKFAKAHGRSYKYYDDELDRQKEVDFKKQFEEDLEEARETNVKYIQME